MQTNGDGLDLTVLFSESKCTKYGVDDMTKAAGGFIAELWCRMLHSSPMWPAHGHYQCRTCGREYPVPWELDRKRAGSQAITQAAERVTYV